MPGKAKAVLVPYELGVAPRVERWGDPPYFQIAITARDHRGDFEGTRGSHYYSKEMLANLHSEIGALLAKDAHAQS